MDSAAPNTIVILGLGGGGNRIASQVARGTLPDHVRVGAADTDIRALEQLQDVIPIPLGEEWAGNESCGGDLVLGERATSASSNQLRDFLKDARLLICIASMGGGTGSGGARVIARLARDLKLPSVFVTSLPFSFEGQWKRRQAELGLEPVRKLSQAVIEVPNDVLFTTMSPDTTAAEAFKLADQYLAQAVQGLAQLAFANGIISADFAALRTILGDRQATSTLGFGKGTGPNRWQVALEELGKCPLIGGNEALSNANAAIVTILGGDDLTMREIQSCLESFQRIIQPDAIIVAGAYTRPGLKELHVTALLCQYRDDHPTPAPIPRPARQTAPAPTPKISRPKTKTAPPKEFQGELPLMEHSLGIFSRSQPTSIGGQNLDIPTFQRQGIVLDIGE